MDTFHHRILNNGIDLWVYPTQQFKETRVEVYLHRDLDVDTTLTALIPQVLMRGSQGFPDMKAIETELAALYGAVVGGRMHKKGERLLMQLSLGVIADRYLDEPMPVLSRGMALLADILLRPVEENGAFRSDYVDQEKKALQEAIEGIVNDKRAYAQKRCIEIMCADEPYRRYVYGDLADLPQIDASRLYQHYRRFLVESPMEIYCLGAVDVDEVAAICNTALGFARQGDAPLQPTVFPHAPKDVRRVIEREPCQQGKLVMGYRTGIQVQDPGYYALLMYNQILGGSGNSKLFMQVREKASLAYYVASSVDTGKGLMMIHAGIDPGALDQTLDIIHQQGRDMEAGRISDTEWRQSQKTLLEGLKKVGDSPGAVISLAMSGRLYHRNQSLAEIMAEVEKVTVDDVMAVARQIRLDTIYFLTAEAEGMACEFDPAD